MNVNVSAKCSPSANKSAKSTRGGRGCNRPGVDLVADSNWFCLCSDARFPKLAHCAISLRGTNQDVSRRRDNYVYWSVHGRYKRRPGGSPRFYHARTTAQIYIYRGLLNAPQVADFSAAPGATGTLARSRIESEFRPFLSTTLIFSFVFPRFEPLRTIVYDDVTRAVGQNESAFDIGSDSNGAMHSSESRKQYPTRSSPRTYSIVYYSNRTRD